MQAFQEILKAEFELKKLEHEQAMGQLEINKTEAQHKSIFVSGWRPFIGWVGGFGLAYAAIFHPFLIYIFGVLSALGMLGIGAMRSFDKVKGTQTDAIG